MDMTAVSRLVDIFSATTHPEDTTVTATANASEVAETESQTVLSSATPPTLLTVRLGSTQQLVIFSSIIVGVLTFCLLLAALGWMLDHAEVFGDPLGKSVHKLIRKKTEESSSPFRQFPFIRPTMLREDPDMPSWIGNHNSFPREDEGERNGGYEEAMGDIERGPHRAVRHHPQIHSEIVLSEQNTGEYDDVQAEPAHATRHNGHVKPSAIAAFERRNRWQKTENAEVRNAYETSIPNYSNGHGVHESAPETSTYELTVPGDEEQYGGSLYSNSSMIPPTVPPRTRHT